MNRQTIIWDKIGRICIYLLFGLVPVFFLPLTAFPVAENKAMLAGLLVFLAFGVWLAKVLSEGKLYIPKTWFWAPLSAFLVLALISSMLSGAVSQSIWGNLTSSDSFFNFLIYVLALFLVPLYLRDAGQINRAILFFSISLFVLAIYSVLQFFGIFVLPFDFAKQVSFNPIGTVQGLAIFLASGLVMATAVLAGFKLSQILKLIFILGAVLFAFVLLLINFNFVWLGIFVASALIVSWQIMHSRRQISEERTNADPQVSMGGIKFSLPLVLMIIVAILFFVNPPISSIVQLPAEVRPSFSATLDIARGTLSSGLVKTLVGSGPAMFLYEYLMHRSPDLNTTAFWGVRFFQGYSTISTLLVTIGVLGLLSILSALGFFIWFSLRGIVMLSRRKSPAERIALVSFVGFLFLMFSWFFYPINFTLFLFTFLFAGLVIAALRLGDAIGKVEFSILKTQQRTFIASLILIVLIVGTIVGLYWQGQKYIASVFHTLGVQAHNRDRDIDSAVSRVSVAINLDNERDRYLRTFSQLLALRAGETLSNTELDSGELQARYQRLLQGLIQAAQGAIRANPVDPLNWRQLGAIYEDNIFIVGGADNFAIKNYEEAAGRNPHNPAEYLNVARAYVKSSDSARRQISQLSASAESDSASADASDEVIEKLEARRAEQLSRALENLQKAIELKGDYAPAHFLSSQVYERQGNRELAIKKTLETRNLNPLDTGVGYQLALLYYLDERFGDARAEFERIVGLNTDFSNARYFLGLTYDKLGNKGAAIEQFEKIAELNPENQEVVKILGNLRGGKDALAGIVPPAVPPQERIETPVPQTGGGEAIEELAPTEGE